MHMHALVTRTRFVHFVARHCACVRWPDRGNDIVQSLGNDAADGFRQLNSGSHLPACNDSRTPHFVLRARCRTNVQRPSCFVHHPLGCRTLVLGDCSFFQNVLKSLFAWSVDRVMYFVSTMMSNYFILL